MSGIILMALLVGADPSGEPFLTQTFMSLPTGQYRVVRSQCGRWQVCGIGSVGAVWSFKGHRLDATGANFDGERIAISIEYQCNPGRQPFEFTLMHKDRCQPGIFQTQGNRLLLCFDIWGLQRPDR